MSALVDLPGSGSAGQLVYFSLTQICGSTCIQVLAHTGQVPVKSQVLTDIPSSLHLDHSSIHKYSQCLYCEHDQFMLLVMQTLLY
jgi:hypothetical protein